MSALLESLKQKKPSNKFETINIKITKDTDAKIKIINKKHLDSAINLQAFRKKIINRKTQSMHDISVFKEDKLKIPVQLKKKTTFTKSDEKEEETDEKQIKHDKKRIDENLKKDTETLDKDIDEPILTIDERLIKIKGKTLAEILPEKHEPIKIKPSTYFLHNREKFVNFINSVYKPYKEQLKKDKKNISCYDFGTKNEFALLTHQELVRDYINIYSPYRGLLLYHGLGAGKTCSSIAIAEGLKTTNQIIIMTPASLRSNYIKELKKCGDPLYKLNQNWEFIKTDGNKHLETALSKILSIHIDTIRKTNGAWLVNTTKPANYEKLSIENKNALNKQIDFMISLKYTTINYNGLRANSLAKYESDAVTEHGRSNLFDNKVVIIDEAHNFVSRIVNKLESKKPSLSKKLYEYLLDAHNCRVILLTGTPIINYPNEIGILYNILRGYIKTYELTLDTSKTDKKIDNEKIKNIFKNYGIIDYIEYIPRKKTLKITRNPYGFISKINRKSKDYNGIVYNERGKINDKTFKDNIIQILAKQSISIKAGTTKIINNKALPDKFKNFNEKFIDPETHKLKNKLLFKKRILGLTSYFRSASERLLPKFNEEKDIKVINVPMSDYQLGVYESARIVERKEELRNSMKKKTSLDQLLNDSSSTYRIFSRAFCNFVFPDEIIRPLPSQQKSIDDIYKSKKKTNLDEDVMDGATIKQKLGNLDGRYSIDDEEEIKKKNSESMDQTYGERIISALQELEENGEKYLSLSALKTYSPKFREILKRLSDGRKIGIHLIYSQFRTLEGIGILSLILKHNGWAEFKINKTSAGIWKINMNRQDLDKPCYALYTGTENAEEKEIIRNILNSRWDIVPESIKTQLTENGFKNNHTGEVIKTLMITSSGAEGIDLKNVRYVHIVEPYWHPVRKQQVIGRARRICSHMDLPPKLQTVTVFVYIMVFTDIQKKGDPTEKDTKKKGSKLSNELRKKDTSKINSEVPITTDEALMETSNRKEMINKEILYELKTTSIDCAIYADGRSREKLLCYNFGSLNSNKFLSVPSYADETDDKISMINIQNLEKELEEVNIRGKKYFIKKDNEIEKTGILYDYDAIKNGSQIIVGKLIKDKKGHIKKVKV
jgi:hypothetical protein